MTGEADVRGFAYPLEPLLKVQEWGLEALQLKLGRVERTLRNASAACIGAQTAYQEHAAEVRKIAGVRLEPGAYVLGLAHLAYLRREIESRERTLEELRKQRRSLQDEFLRVQVKVNLTSSHKDECLNEYLLAQQNRLNSERDRDWLARAAHFENQEAE
ncbi:MAG: hypothetical protein ACJ8LG_23110 [Massilia sp.]